MIGGAATGEKRIAVERLIRAGLHNREIVAKANCSLVYVAALRAALGAPAVPERDRIEQAIARGLDDARIAAEEGASLARVARVRADLDAVSDDGRDDAAVVGMPTTPLKAAIVADLRAGMTQTDAAIRHGVNRASVSRLARRWCSDVVFVRGRRRAA